MPDQLSGFTSFDRYPRIFRLLPRLKADSPELRILSFGCSTGEEVRTLRELYFPLARIDGVDARPAVIENLIQSNTDPGIRFLHQNELGPDRYDLIVAMSVLCRCPRTTRKRTKEYSFSIFQRTIRQIDKLLSVGGFLAIYNTQFLFEETTTGRKYSPIPCYSLHRHFNRLSRSSVGVAPRFWRNGKKHRSPHPIFYQKLISDRMIRQIGK